MCHMCDEYEADLRRMGLIEVSKQPPTDPRSEKRELPPALRSQGKAPEDAPR